MATRFSGEEQDATIITVRIGMREETYALVETTAPKAYDYGTTLELQSGGELRYVLAPVRIAESQIARYRSGLYATAPHDVLDEEWLATFLWARFAKALGAEDK